MICFDRGDQLHGRENDLVAGKGMTFAHDRIVGAQADIPACARDVR